MPVCLRLFLGIIDLFAWSLVLLLQKQHLKKPQALGNALKFHVTKVSRKAMPRNQVIGIGSMMFAFGLQAQRMKGLEMFGVLCFG